MAKFLSRGRGCWGEPRGAGCPGPHTQPSPAQPSLQYALRYRELRAGPSLGALSRLTTRVFEQHHWIGEQGPKWLSREPSSSSRLLRLEECSRALAWAPVLCQLMGHGTCLTTQETLCLSSRRRGLPTLASLTLTA